MKSFKCAIVIALFALIAAPLVLAKSHRHRNGTEGGRRNNNKNGQNRNGRNNNKNEGFRCPEMACMPVNPTCRNVEYLVLQFAEINSASDVTFECRGCDYCLDFRSMQKRDARRHHHQHGVESRRKTEFQCPGVADTCSESRPVTVHISGVPGRSWSCPACFDQVRTGR